MRIGTIGIIFSSVFAFFIAGKVISENAFDFQNNESTYMQDSIKKISLSTAENVFFNHSKTVDSQNSDTTDKIVEFAEALIGIPYLYAGKVPSTGFDCSGFTSYVYKHFGYDVSPASKEQVNAGHEIALENVKKGDLLIFTGTDVNKREPGHVGIVISNDNNDIQFIHSSSNKHKWGVTISNLSDLSYSKRFLQARRIAD